MGRIEKTVFISYRRTNASWALAIFQHLKQHNYDVFLDFSGIASGDFESVILENINARAHFIVVLTPSALERCSEPGDWLRREIETAIQAKRNIVPLMLEGFKFSTPTIASQLTATLEPLRHYNAVNVTVDYFDEAMERLRQIPEYRARRCTASRFLTRPAEREDTAGCCRCCPLGAGRKTNRADML